MVTFSPVANGDDGYWEETTSGFNNSSPASSFGHPNTTVGPRNAFIRFPGVTIPQGATIDSAIITFVASGNLSGTTVNARIAAIDDDNAAAPTTYAGAEGATRTTATVDWNNIGAWTNLTQYDTPEIKTVIQEIVDRVGWSSGNALVVYVEDNGSTVNTNRHRQFSTVEASGTVEAVLAVTYSVVPPTAPSDLAATAVSSSQINTTWTDNSNDEDNFELQYDTVNTFDSGGETTVEPAADAELYNVTGLSPETTYYFRIRAVSGAGESDWSNTASDTTLAASAYQPRPGAAMLSGVAMV
jgi:hypothetical protein